MTVRWCHVTAVILLQSSLDSWCVPLLQACESYITALLQDNGRELEERGNHDEVEICTYLFTLGELAQVCVFVRTFTYVHNVFVCAFTYTCVCVCAFTYIVSVCVRVYIHMFVCVCVYIYMCLFVCAFTYTCVCLFCVCMYLCMYLCMVW